jgi:putative MATE family efflux protein
MRDWTKGGLTKNLLLLSWPIIVSDALNTIGPTIDMLFIGRLGSAAIAAIGVAGMVIMLVILGGIGMNMGLRAMVARFVGANDTESINNVVMQAFIINGAYGLGIALFGYLFARQILMLFGVEGGVLVSGTAYLKIAILNAIPMSYHMLTEACLQASGDTVRPMILSIVMRAIHVILVPFLIFGLWIFPELGVRGAAISQLISVLCGVITGFWILFTGRSRLNISLKNFHVDPGLMWRMLKISFPATIMFVQRGFARLVLMTLVVPFGTLAVASFSIIQRLELFVTMPVFGLGRASAVLVGQNLGARQPERAAKSVWLATGISEVCLLITCGLMFIWPEYVIRIFSPEHELITVASSYLMVFLIGFLSIGFDVVLVNALTGAGVTLPPMIITLSRMWVITLPLAYIWSKFTGLGVYGVWWGLIVGMVFGAAAYTVYFISGRWKLKIL